MAMEAAESAAKMSSPQRIPWAAANGNESLLWSLVGASLRRAARYSATSRAPAGTAGKMYPGNLDCDALKNKTGTSIQMRRNSGQESSGLEKACLPSDQIR